jgi:hypothetical protein
MSMTTEPGLLPPPTGAAADVPRLAPAPVPMPAPVLQPTVPVDGPALPAKAPKADGIRDTAMIELPPILRPSGPPPVQKKGLFDKDRIRRVFALLIVLGVIIAIGVFVRQRLGDPVDTAPVYTPVAAGVEVRTGDLTFVMPSQPTMEMVDITGPDTDGLVGRAYAVALPAEDVEVRVVQAQRDSSMEDLQAFCNGAINELAATLSAPVATNTNGVDGDIYRQSVVWNTTGGVMSVDCIAKASTGAIVVGLGAGPVLPATVAVVQSVTITD